VIKDIDDKLRETNSKEEMSPKKEQNEKNREKLKKMNGEIVIADNETGDMLIKADEELISAMMLKEIAEDPSVKLSFETKRIIEKMPFSLEEKLKKIINDTLVVAREQNLKNKHAIREIIPDKDRFNHYYYLRSARIQRNYRKNPKKFIDELTEEIQRLLVTTITHDKQNAKISHYIITRIKRILNLVTKLVNLNNL